MPERFELVIRGGAVIDGTRAPRFAADVAVRGDRIACVGRLDSVRGALEIDAGGKIVAPGFIDAHTHDDRLMLSAPDVAPKVSQGITTVVAGNCGISLAPMPAGAPRPVTPPLDLLDDEGGWFRFRTFAEYVGALRDAPPATNAALLVGHTTLRVATLDDVGRAARPPEIGRMREKVREALAAGAIGVSTGLYYEPAAPSPTEEVIEVCRPLAEFGGLYCTHMRDEAERVLDSLEEAFRIGRAVDAQVVISHHKVAGLPNHGRSRETLPLIASRMRSQRIGLDCYPYCASSTVLSVARAAVASQTLVTWSKPHPEYAGMDIAAVAAKMGVPQEAAIERLLPAGAIYFAMDEGDVQRILAFEPTMVGSDGLPHDAAPHPRLWGSFPRVLGHYARDLGLFPLETAVHKMTGLTARTFGLQDRGIVKEGAYADLTIFDPGTVGEAATFARPIQAAHGIEAVIVNGALVWHEGRSTGARPGRVIARHPCA
ncbi:MAG TPA: D-aminoacylase [Burkholderiales bacterium]|nr:D-aminoacylase [Burkholderiales bacterium]